MKYKQVHLGKYMREYSQEKQMWEILIIICPVSHQDNIVIVIKITKQYVNEYNKEIYKYINRIN